MKNNKYLLLGLLFLLFSANCHKQLSQIELVQFVNETRAEAEQYYKKKEYDKAIKSLEQIYALTEARALHFEWIRILYDLTRNYSLVGNKEKALFYLDETIKAGFADFEQLQEENDFMNIKNEEKFRRLLKKLKDYQLFWESPSFETSYREDISENEKIAGLAKLWAEIKNNFINFDLVPDVNWDMLFFDYLPKVRKTKSTLEYYKVLQMFCAQLKDGHTQVRMPKELQSITEGRVPIKTRLIENKVLITKLYDEKLRERGIKPGLEILSVNGIPVETYVEENIVPYQNDNTSQGFIRSTYEYTFLRGSVNESVELELEETKGHIFRRSIDRVAKMPGRYVMIDFKTLDENIGYLIINSFAWDEVLAKFYELFPLIQKTEALIIDLRENGGGSGQIGWPILGCFTDKPFTYQKWISRKYRPIWRAWGRGPEFFEEPAGIWPADKKRYYKRPVVLLTRDRTASMAENFCLGFRVMNRGKIIGGRTCGSSGTPLFFSLPGGGRGQVVTNRGMFPDGKEYIGKGITPDIEVYPTVEAIRSGKDRILETALDYLRSLLKGWSIASEKREEELKIEPSKKYNVKDVFERAKDLASLNRESIWPGYDFTRYVELRNDETSSSPYLYLTNELNNPNPEFFITIKNSQTQERSMARNLDLLFHEAFHCFQWDSKRTGIPWRTELPKGLFKYGAISASDLAGFYLESIILRRALFVEDETEFLEFARQFVALRRQRQKGKNADVIDYETGAELNEGVAKYIGMKAVLLGISAQEQDELNLSLLERDPLQWLSSRFGILEDAQKISDNIRVTLYLTGAIQAFILDKLMPEWKTHVQEKASPLQDLLAKALDVNEKDDSKIAREVKEREEFNSLIMEVETALLKTRAKNMSLAKSILEFKGWKIVIDMSEIGNLATSGFAPNRVAVIDSYKRIHESFVRLDENGFLSARFYKPVLEDEITLKYFSHTRPDEIPFVTLDGIELSLDKSGQFEVTKRATIKADRINIIFEEGQLIIRDRTLFLCLKPK
ncbi:MAG: hypothetical protein GTO16_05675 [Candidatus Aminicenantes bacterium]|nr:hypothetical protein [Candidatus Aminicenantes bacterium]